MLTSELDQAERDRFERDADERIEYDRDLIALLFDEQTEAYADAPAWYWS